MPKEGFSSEFAVKTSDGWWFFNPKMKKEANDVFFKINTCQASGTPYNAPPLTRNNDANVIVTAREK